MKEQQGEEEPSWSLIQTTRLWSLLVVAVVQVILLHGRRLLQVRMEYMGRAKLVARTVLAEVETEAAEVEVFRVL